MAQVDGALDVSHVCRLTCTARNQDLGGHDARAVELFERAIAAAEALRQPDCLIVARLRCWYLGTQHNMTCDALSGCDSADAKRGVAARIVAQYQAHLPGVLETLERRRAAGTLHSGCCRAHEVAWNADCMRTDVIRSGEPELAEETVSEIAPLLGVQAYFAAARVAVCASQTGLGLWLVPDEPLLGRCLNFIEHALLLTLGRESDDGELTGVPIPSVEPLFLSGFREVLLPFLKPEEPRCGCLLEAWRGIEQSDLLQKMELEQMDEYCDRINKSLADAQAAKDAGVPLRLCALPSCGAREAHVAHFKKCSACGQVVYCSKAHQTEHWPAHKAACKAARKAASQAAGEGGASQDA